MSIDSWKPHTTNCLSMLCDSCADDSLAQPLVPPKRVSLSLQIGPLKRFHVTAPVPRCCSHPQRMAPSRSPALRQAQAQCFVPPARRGARKFRLSPVHGQIGETWTAEACTGVVLAPDSKRTGKILLDDPDAAMPNKRAATSEAPVAISRHTRNVCWGVPALGHQPDGTTFLPLPWKTALDEQLRRAVP